jgi:hypothetical protein
MFKHLVDCICNDIVLWALPVLEIAPIHHVTRTLRYNVSPLGTAAETQQNDEAHAEE